MIGIKLNYAIELIKKERILKKIFFIIFSLLMTLNCAFAIDWVNLKSPSGNEVALDKDSIKDYKGYYFYNIKLELKNHKQTVVTIQSSKNTLLAARIKYYALEEYNNLKGDYENILNNATTTLEAVTYDSRVNTCFREVKKIIERKNQNKIEISF